MFREFATSWIVRDWLTDPVFVLFALTLLLGWLSLRPRRRRRSSSRSYTASARTGAGIFRWLVFIGVVAAFFVSSAPVIVNPLIDHLESRHADQSSECSDESPIVVLGGGVDSRVEQADEFERMSSATLARLAKGLELATTTESNRLIVVGGAIRKISEADVMANFLIRTGFNEDFIFTENTSKNTWENAIAVSSMLNEKTWPKEVRLVTSALHMTRAKASFESMNLTVCTVPVDRIALQGVPLWALAPQTSALVKFDKLLHEWLGLFIYRLQGKLS